MPQERARRNSETVQQREQRLRKWRMRDRARCAAQTVEQRELCLQQRRDQLATESMQEKGQATADEGSIGCRIS